jgi:hypothetical protein
VVTPDQIKRRPRPKKEKKKRRREEGSWDSGEWFLEPELSLALGSLDSFTHRSTRT